MLSDTSSYGILTQSRHNQTHSPARRKSSKVELPFTPVINKQLDVLKPSSDELPKLPSENSVIVINKPGRPNIRREGPPPLRRTRSARRSLSPDSHDLRNLPSPSPRSRLHLLSPGLSRPVSPFGLPSRGTEFQTPPLSLPNKPCPKLTASRANPTAYAYKLPRPKGQPMRRYVPLGERANLLLKDSHRSVTGDSSVVPGRLRPSVHYVDRLLPNRAVMNLGGSQALLGFSERLEVQRRDPEFRKPQDDLALALDMPIPDRILAYAGPQIRKVPARALLFPRSSSVPSYSLHTRSSTTTELPKTTKRYVSNKATRILDAPGFEDDYYANNLVWSRTNFLAIGLRDLPCTDSLVYIWNAALDSIFPLTEDPFVEKVCGLSWSRDGEHLAVGLANGDCQIWDATELELVRTLKCSGEATPLSCMSWSPSVFATGNHLGQMAIHDLRIPDHMVQALESHESQVCNLTWREDGLKLASSGEDGFVKVFDGRAHEPLMSRRIHSSTVKGLAWCPWNPNILASGGGEGDHRIKIVNTSTKATQVSADTGSLVSSLFWSPHTKELVATHGAPQNHFSLWTPDLKPVAEVPAHQERILQSALSPDGLTFCTIASDTDLKFWTPFKPMEKPPTSRIVSSIASFNLTSLR